MSELWELLCPPMEAESCTHHCGDTGGRKRRERNPFENWESDKGSSLQLTDFLDEPLNLSPVDNLLTSLSLGSAGLRGHAAVALPLLTRCQCPVSSCDTQDARCLPALRTPTPGRKET